MRAGKYSFVRAALHWLSAAFILWALIMGAFAGTLAEGAPLRTGVAALNVSLATLFVPVFIWRLWLRLRAPRERPVSLGDHVAHWAHNLLYLLTGSVLLTGLLMMNRPIRIFDWLTLPQPLHEPKLLHRLMQLHTAACLLLAALVVLHVLAVIKHEASGRRVLRRML